MPEATTLEGRPPPARRPVRRWLTTLLVVLLAVTTFVVWLPFLMVLTAGVITTQMGCRADEAAAYPCFIAGRDMGSALYFMGMMGWVAIGILPAMLATVVAWLIFVLVRFALWMRRRMARETA